MKKIVICFILLVSILISLEIRAEVNTVDNAPGIMFTYDEAIVITGKVYKHKKHKRKTHPVSSDKNHKVNQVVRVSAPN